MKPAAHGKEQSWRSRASFTLPCQKRQEGPIAAIHRMAAAALAQVRTHPLGLFRTQLVIKIFP
ncbi:MAG TPA: hypothetical protein VFU40_09125, partial [Gemmatimonadales bacterium]|nr:hypothetical protein [Gemmatimonadales bacterium]